MSEFRRPLVTPPAGAVTMAVARHLSPTRFDPLYFQYIEDRHRLVYDLVDQCSLDVVDWGTGDHTGSGNEEWQLIFEGVMEMIGAAAPIIAAWIARPQRSSGEPQPTVRAVRFKRPDGAELELPYKDGNDLETAASTIRNFLAPAVEDGSRGAE
jgi:hypothetical protein